MGKRGWIKGIGWSSCRVGPGIHRVVELSSGTFALSGIIIRHTRSAILDKIFHIPIHLQSTSFQSNLSGNCQYQLRRSSFTRHTLSPIRQSTIIPSKINLSTCLQESTTHFDSTKLLHRGDNVYCHAPLDPTELNDFFPAGVTAPPLFSFSLDVKLTLTVS